MFAAVVAGAAPINLTTEFNTLFRGSGQNNVGYDIFGQGRYGTDPYTDPDLYYQQSPISGVKTMNTALLQMQGDNDQTVEYLQGMEFYNALRFNKKNVIFLSYPGRRSRSAPSREPVRLRNAHGRVLRSLPQRRAGREVDGERRAVHRQGQARAAPDHGAKESTGRSSANSGDHAREVDAELRAD